VVIPPRGLTCAENGQSLPWGETESKNQNPSSWEPPGPPTLEAFIVKNEMDLERTATMRPHNQNLSTHYHHQTSKGSAVVVMNKTDYITEALRQLSNRRHYIPLDLDPTRAHAGEVQKAVDTTLLRQEIPPKCGDFLCVPKPRTPNFYLLPKIHNGIYPPPGRPIVSGNGCPTERISL
jgi:hypothetical protein